MASLSSVSPELILHIARQLDFLDRKSFSSLNAQFRGIIAPDLFRTIRFTNLEEDEDIISHVVSRHGKHAHDLQFDFHLKQDVFAPSDEALPEGQFHGTKKEGDDDDDDPEDEDGDEDEDEDQEDEDEDAVPGTKLTSIASQILAGEKAPGVPSLTIKFIPENDFKGDGWGDDEGLGSVYIYEDPVPAKYLADEEADWPSWRRTMAQMWSVLCGNQCINSLAIVEIPAMPLSSWLAPEWPAFLGRLNTLHLGMGGGSDDNGAGWSANRTEGYREFLENLGKHFFNHTTALRKLHLKASATNFYGINGDIGTVTALRGEQMPKLEELCVENCFVDEQLCIFMERKSGPPSTLKKLHLIDCMANEATPRWAQIFSRLAARPNLSLEELVVANSNIEFVNDDEPKVSHLPVLKRLKNKFAVRSSPEQDGEKGRPFAYGVVDDKYGMVLSETWLNSTELERGADMEAYRGLLRLVDDNKKETAMKTLLVKS